jgi:hypothetical protein
MGMYPSADLLYGIELGDIDLTEPEEERDHEKFTWLTRALWEESWEWEAASSTYLARQGIEGVSLQHYGHPDYLQTALVTRSIGCHLWGDTTEVTQDSLTVTDDDERLSRAWALLFPGEEPGPIAWRMSVTFG